MKLFGKTTPEKAFKHSVRPLGLYLFISGLLFTYMHFEWPAESLHRAPVPFVPDPLKEYLFVFCALVGLVFGAGLFFRNKLIWRLFIAYVFIGPAWPILGIAFDYFPGSEPKAVIIPLATFMSLLVAFGLYKVTKPAFEEAS